MEFLGDAGQGRRRVGEIDAGDPVLRLVQRHIRMQHAMGLAVREDAFSRRQRKQRAAADRFRARLVADIAVKQVGFDE
jgi:hypothetical protein